MPPIDEERIGLGEFDVAVLIPCFNEEVSIGQVVSELRASIPDSRIYVYDNNSTDDTRRVAAAAGAIVRCEALQGKGNVVRRMFADIDADIYLLIDGDGTYDTASASKMLQCVVTNQCDMVNAARRSDCDDAYRMGHRMGNILLSNLVGWIFGDRIRDMLSGYKVFSRRFVKSFPALSSGFEIETELTVHALELRMPVAEIEATYNERAIGSHSKLNTFRDGFRILGLILILIKEERPLAFFVAVSVVLGATSIGISLPLLHTYLATGLVPRFPTAILATGLMTLAFLSMACGLVLETVTRGRRELKRMFYLGIPPLRISEKK